MSHQSRIPGIFTYFLPLHDWLHDFFNSEKDLLNQKELDLSAKKKELDLTKAQRWTTPVPRDNVAWSLRWPLWCSRHFHQAEAVGSSLVGCWLRSGSCGVRRQVWPWMPRQESSVEHRRSRLLRCSDEWWVTKKMPFDFGQKTDFLGWFQSLWNIHVISWATWQGWGAYCHGQSSWLLSAEKLAHINWEMLPKAPKFSANPGHFFFCFQFFLKSIILWMSWVGSDFFSMLVVGIF